MLNIYEGRDTGREGGRKGGSEAGGDNRERKCGGSEGERNSILIVADIVYIRERGIS